MRSPHYETVVARLHAGDISQQKLARELGISQASVNRLWRHHLRLQAAALKPRPACADEHSRIGRSNNC